jgi:hypothetical protein
VVVSGEGKGPEAKFGSDDFQKEDRKGTTVIVPKRTKTVSLDVPEEFPAKPRQIQKRRGH